MTIALVTDFLRQRIGLDPETLGPSTVVRAVRTRMEALGLAEAAAYAARLANDPHEYQLLLDEVTVPETWFFRGGDLFSYLARLIAQAVRLQRLEEQYRVLSIPCSSGEEPYSLAIALEEAGVPPGACSIWGVDINARLIERARQGRFGDLSFRQTTPEVRQRYFRVSGSDWVLTEEIRKRVHFQLGNLLDRFFLAGEGRFDLIFCRNLLIYLDSASRRRAVDTLKRLLAGEGFLCMGHAEPLAFADPRFQRTGPNAYFLYRARGEAVVNPRDPEGQSPLALSCSTWESSKPGPPVPVSAAASSPVQPAGRSLQDRSRGGASPNSAGTVGNNETAPPPPVAAEPPAENLLQRAREQADRGRLDDAMATCRACLDRSLASADLFGLMGVLHRAHHQKEEAARCFQRALYLDPGHRDSLTHLMLLYQEAGDARQAARLRRRLERTGSGGES
jgi:chemotaxis protein methyltransferase WspC